MDTEITNENNMNECNHEKGVGVFINLKRLKKSITRIPTRLLIIILLVIVPLSIFFVLKHGYDIYGFSLNNAEKLRLLFTLTVGVIAYIGTVIIGLSAYSINNRNRKSKSIPKIHLPQTIPIDGSGAKPDDVTKARFDDNSIFAPDVKNKLKLEYEKLDVGEIYLSPTSLLNQNPEKDAEKSIEVFIVHSKKNTSGHIVEERFTQKLSFINNGDVITNLQITKLVICWDNKEKTRYKNIKKGEMCHPISKGGIINIFCSELCNDKDQMLCSTPFFTAAGKSENGERAANKKNNENKVRPANFKKLIFFFEVCNESGEWHFFKYESIYENNTVVPKIYMEPLSFN